MAMGKREAEQQQDLFITHDKLPRSPGHVFYRRLNQLLAAGGFDRWVEALTGRTLSSRTGWERNHFDRLVHFCYGLLLAYPAREVFLRVADVRGFWGYYLPLDVVMATSMLYELIEWGSAVVFAALDAPDASTATCSTAIPSRKPSSWSATIPASASF